MNLEKNNGDASSVFSALIATEGVASTSSIADTEMCHSETRMKKEKCSTLEVINEDHNPQNDAAIMLTPLINKPVTELNPETESEVTDLISELSAPQEKKEKRKLKKMKKELSIDGKDPVPPEDASTLIETDAVAHIGSTTDSEMCHSGSELTCITEKTKRKKEKRSTLKTTNEDHNPQNVAAIKITPLINEPVTVTELNPETDSQVSRLDSELSAPQEKKEKRKPKKMKKELGIDGKDTVPPEDALITSTPVATDDVARISSTTDPGICHSGSELVCKPEKTKRKKEKSSTLEISDEVHNPQNDAAIKITPFVNEPVTVLNPEIDSEVSHLNSELSAPQEKKEKRKLKKIKKELGIDGKDLVPPEDALITSTLIANDAVPCISLTTDSELCHSGSELTCKPEKTKRKKEKRSTLKNTNEDHDPQNDAPIKITPLINEPLTVNELNPETDSQVSLLNSEFSAPQEKKEKRKPKKMKKELGIDGKDPVPPEDALLASTPVATDAVTRISSTNSGSELTCIPEKTGTKKEKRSTLKVTYEDHNPQNDAATKITPLINEPVTELNPETDSQVSHLDSELSAPQEKKEKRKRKKMKKELGIDGKDPVPPEDALITSTPVATDAVACISSTTDSEVCYSGSELTCTPEKTKRKKVKRSTLKITNEDPNPQNDAAIMITPLINESVTELDPETDSQVSHLNSELSSPQENKEKKKRKMIGKESNIDGKDPVPLENASPAKATLLVKDAEISLGPKAGSEEIPLDSDLSCPQEKRRKRRKLEKNNNSLEVNPSSDSFSEAHISDGLLILHTSPERVHLTRSKKKLIVLDLNGLLADIVPLLGRNNFKNLGEKAVGKPFYHTSQGYKPYGRVGDKTVFKRPFCDEFLEFCFRNFDVAVWSSRTKINTNQAVNLIFRDRQMSLIFCWDRSKCTITDFKTIENREKPIVLKDLRKVWNFCREKWSWKGFNESNTLLVDDSPYKALCNPEYTAIFPPPYEYTDQADCSLGKNGDLRQYLERFAHADDAQKFVKENPFGQRGITDANLSWTFYKKIIDSVSEKEHMQNSYK